MAQQITDAEIEERTHLLELVKISTEVFSRQQYERLKELSNKMFASAGSPHIAKENTKHMAQETALKWLYEIMFVKKGTITFEEYQHALEMNKHQHGDTWNSAIKAHDDRGHVHARSLVDFDEYFMDTFKK